MSGTKYSDNTLSIVLFLSAGIWGLLWIPLREMEKLGLPDAWSGALFNFCPLVVLVPYILWQRKTLLRNLRPVLLAGIFTGIAISFYTTGLVVSTVVRATMLFYLVPIWSTIIGVIWLSEKLTKGRILAIAMGLTGVFLMLSGNDETTAPLNVGDLLALLSGMFWAIGGACIKRWPDLPTLTLTATQLIVTVTSSVLLGLFLFSAPPPSASAVVSAIPVAFLVSILVMLPIIILLFWISKHLFPGRVGLLMMSEVLLAVISASILLPHETMTPIQWVGGAIIVTACLVEMFGSSPKPSELGGANA